MPIVLYSKLLLIYMLREKVLSVTEEQIIFYADSCQTLPIATTILAVAERGTFFKAWEISSTLAWEIVANANSREILSWTAQDDWLIFDKLFSPRLKCNPNYQKQI